MAERKPVVLVSGQLQELPAGDTLPPQTPAAHSHATSDVTGLDAALAGKEPTIAAGTTNQYFRGDKSWRDFFTDVRAATLTGLSTATNAAIAATDTVLSALGKLQAQVNHHSSLSENAHPASAISNTPAGGISATTVQAAINELDTEKFDKTGGSISGGISVAGNVLATSGTLGYGVGAGGTATQAPSKSTAVTLNKPSGQITMHNTALAAGADVVFVVNCDKFAATDTVFACITAGVSSFINYDIATFAQGPGQFAVRLRNRTASPLSEAVVFNFEVRKVATA